MGFDSDFTQISAKKNGEWSLCSMGSVGDPAVCLHQVVAMLRRSANICFRMEYWARKFQCMLADIASATVSMLQRQTEVKNARICGENIVEYLILRLDNLASRCHPHARDLPPSHLGGEGADPAHQRCESGDEKINVSQF